ncbi:stromal membrane-associated protein 2-like [Corticium candelabrum]|uniref:stromal membrane-associated protein 2-like n=1 Tax=Corticium candelabrum TaxID=121492 RepID=UPI002E25A659|nr:stromal membrane-associated protein 2-like [Corticium candelabrum]
MDWPVDLDESVGDTPSFRANLSFSEQDMRRLEIRTAELKRIAGNETCADCDSPDSMWASINLGVTLCIDCSGIYRNQATLWSTVLARNLEGWKKPTTQSSRDERETYIRVKYVNKQSDDNGDEDPFPVATDKREVTMDSVVLSEATSDSDRISPEIHRKTYSQPVSPVRRCHWLISKPKRAQLQDKLDVSKDEGEVGSISDTETVSKPKKSRRKRVTHNLKKLSQKKKLLTMTGTEKEESRLRQLSVELHTHAGGLGNSSQILYEATKTGDISGMLLALACGELL